MIYIATSHGSYAESCVQTLKMLSGETIPVVSFLENMSKEELKKKYNEILQNNPNESFVFFTDIFGGTPFNTLFELKYEHQDKKIVIITGLSLLMLIVVLEEGNYENLVKQLCDGIKIIENIEISSEEGEEEE